MWNPPLAELLDAKTFKAVSKNSSFTHARDLLDYFPRDYAVAGGQGIAIPEDAQKGEFVMCVGTVVGVKEFHSSKTDTLVTTVTITDGTQRLPISFFGAKYISHNLTEGTRALFFGRLDFFRGQPQLSHPKYWKLGTEQADHPGVASLTDRRRKKWAERLAELPYVPIYRVIGKLDSVTIMTAVDQVLTAMPDDADVGVVPIPRLPAGMLSHKQAYQRIHQPGEAGPLGGYQRLKYDEALALGCVLVLRREDVARHHAPVSPRKLHGLQHRMLMALGYRLTEGQKTVIREIATDLDSERPMSRLLQGEVGSGKTVVALAGMLQVVDSGRQAALLAPTEVLATQHAESLRALLVGLTVEVVLLTGSMPVSAKREALLKIVSGDADIVVGTHALIQKDVEFFDLAMVVVDEQHRFGVEQRDRLRGKGANNGMPHLLVMTATPIPRTIAMTAFGDLQVSTLRELPGGRKAIKSYVISDTDPARLGRAFATIRDEIHAGHQAFIVCPRIEGPGGVLETEESMHRVLPGANIGLLHGRLPAQASATTMAAFLGRAIDVLVATTVIEVGVDVPNATVMFIREADRFGVSQLHQLRGRVGRGDAPAICFFHTTAEYSERLEAVAATNDGFELAEIDLTLRREGNVLGTEQSGKGVLRYLNVATDAEIIAAGKADAERLVAEDPDLAIALSARFNRDSQEYLEKS